MAKSNHARSGDQVEKAVNTQKHEAANNQDWTKPSSITSCSLNPMDLFIWTSMTSSSEPPDISFMDLRLYNLSVHHVCYVDEEDPGKEQDQIRAVNPFAGVLKTLTEFVATVMTRQQSGECSSVVVTWEDHPLATHARAKDARLEVEEINEDRDLNDGAVEVVSESYSYEVQVWVTDWGLDGLWNAANRKVTSLDPFLVLVDLPLEQEIGFRVRMKAKQTKKSVLGFLLPIEFFTTQTDGEWSDVVTLSPTKDEELKAIVTSLAGNKLLMLLLTVCIGFSCLVVVQLYARPGLAMTRQRELLSAQLSRRSLSARSDISNEADCTAATDYNVIDSDKTTQELEHEIHDLRQELSDLEDEVRQLMLFSGCGIETLTPHELEHLECELTHTLKRIRYLKKHGSIPEINNCTKG
ncbi:unnamed protein product [Peronospora belbahrii]|uniref:K-box domain-containing protein n=1 Tax=Peronospora belbahrii TaxID=622444 RepID=A0AAU9L414_9STRA|nr:unnamed protein product [Peronospora belbahrii]